MTPKNDIFSTLKDRWDFFIAIIVILLFSTFIYYELVPSEKEMPNKLGSKTIDASMIGENDTDENGLPNRALLIPDDYQRTKMKIRDLDGEQRGEAILITDFSKSAPNLLIEKESVPSIGRDEIGFEEKHTNIKSDTTAASPIPQESSLILKENEIVEEEISKVDSEVKTPTVIEEVEKDEILDCIIVVGAFKIPKNRKTIVEKLKSLGHEYVEGNLRKGFSYVGVPVSCNNEESKQVLLNELNRAFGINAWVKKK